MIYTLIGIAVYVVISLGFFIGIYNAAKKDRIDFNPVQVIVAFTWLLWLPFYVYFSIKDKPVYGN